MYYWEGEGMHLLAMLAASLGEPRFLSAHPREVREGYCRYTPLNFSYCVVRPYNDFILDRWITTY
jgi:hypothetical protein